MVIQRRTGLVLYALLCMASSHAQPAVDSLETVYLDTRRPDSVRFQAFRKYIWDGYLFRDPGHARSLCDSMYRSAMRKGLLAAAGDACSMRGITYIITDRQDSAIKALHQAEELFEKAGDADGVSVVQNNLGNAYWKKGDLSRAIELYTKSLHFTELKKDSMGIGRTEINIGLIYNDLQDTAHARSHWERALAISERLNDPSSTAMAYFNLSTVLGNAADSTAITYLQRAATGFKEVGNAHYHGTSLCNIAQKLLGMDRQPEAQRMLDSAKVILGRMGDQQLVRPRIVQLELYRRAGLYDKVIREGEPMRAMIDTLGPLKSTMDLYKVLAEAHFNAGSTVIAYERLVTFHHLRDSLLSMENRSGLVRSELRYEYDRRSMADSIQHAAEAAEARLRSETGLAKERGRRNLALALGALLTLVFIGAWQRARLLKRTNTAILDAQTKLVESERAREANEVRMRIARDVHDQLGSDLTKLVLLSTEAKEAAPAGTSDIAALAKDIERIAGEANRSLGDIVWAIDPHHDSLAGLTERVRAHCQRMLKWSKVDHTIDCVHEGPDRPLDPATKRDIYLMLREALNNTIKYAKAKHISVRFHTSGERVEFEVKDDGVGMDGGTGSGNGLKNMQARAERIGGRYHISSAPGSGTAVGFQVVLPPVEGSAANGQYRTGSGQGAA